MSGSYGGGGGDASPWWWRRDSSVKSQSSSTRLHCGICHLHTRDREGMKSNLLCRDWVRAGRPTFYSRKTMELSTGAVLQPVLAPAQRAGTRSFPSGDGVGEPQRESKHSPQMRRLTPDSLTHVHGAVLGHVTNLDFQAVVSGWLWFAFLSVTISLLP
jgi:hypothetical protein